MHQFDETGFVWLVGSLCAMHQAPFDATVLRQQFPPPNDLASLRTAIAHLGLSIADLDLQKSIARRFATPPEGAPALRPLVAFRLLVEPTTSEPTLGDQLRGHSQNARHRLEPIIIGKTEAGLVVYFEVNDPQAKIAPWEDLRKELSNIAFDVSRPATAGLSQSANDDVAAQAKGFGYRWFVSELSRHKRIWRDVVIASLTQAGNEV
jgi:ATP-binding cassette, subfamily B, bacterial HlyB/CyaB